jgi:Domain of unknown function (DUF4381)
MPDHHGKKDKAKRKMNQIDPTSLDRLHDIIEPAPVSMWWPLAPGWWILFGIVLVAGAVILIQWWQWRKATAYRRAALKEMNTITDAAGVSVLLKRVALSAFSRSQVAHLSGPAWVDFLNITSSKSYFKGDSGDILAHIIYASDRVSGKQMANLKTAARNWIKSHEKKVEVSKSQRVEA